MSDPIDRKLVANLRRWQESGQPQAWCEAHQGHWTQAEWLALLSSLWWSDYWPMEPVRVGEMLEECKRCCQNLIRWQLSGHARRWVEARHGQWDEHAWHALLEALRQSEFWPLDPAAVARVMDGHQREWWNLRRW